MQIVRTGSENDPRLLKMLLCGDPGKGKTLFSSTAPNVLLLSVEGGNLSTKDRQIPYVTIENSADFFELIKILQCPSDQRAMYLKTLGFDGPLNCVVVDTIDEVCSILAKERYVSQKHDALTLNDYGWLKEQLKQITTALRNLDLHVIMTAHLKARGEEDGGTSFLPAIEGSFAEKIAGYVDLAVLLRSAVTTEVVNNQPVKVIHRWLQTYADNQHDWIKDRSGRLPFEVPVTFDGDFMRLCNFIWPEGPTMTPAAPEPVPEPAEVPPPEEIPEGTISATEAKKLVFAAADQNSDRAGAAWRTAGLEGVKHITHEQLNRALRLTEIPLTA